MTMKDSFSLRDDDDDTFSLRDDDEDTLSLTGDDENTVTSQMTMKTPSPHI